MSGPEETSESEAFASDVPLTEIFGSHPKTKILAALLGEPADPVTHFSINEMSRISGVDPDTVEECIDTLLSHDILVETDDLDGENTYKLHDESDVVDDMRRLYDTLFEVVPGSDTDR